MRRAVGHIDLEECRFCGEEFESKEDVTEHEIEDHRYCADCNRTFTDRNAIKMVSLGEGLNEKCITV